MMEMTFSFPLPAPAPEGRKELHPFQDFLFLADKAIYLWNIYKLFL